jgi:hypothetical protein
MVGVQQEAIASREYASALFGGRKPFVPTDCSFSFFTAKTPGQTSPALGLGGPKTFEGPKPRRFEERAGGPRQVAGPPENRVSSDPFRPSKAGPIRTRKARSRLWAGGCKAGPCRTTGTTRGPTMITGTLRSGSDFSVAFIARFCMPCALAAWRDLRGWLAMVQRPHHAYAGEHRRPGSSGSIDTAQTATVGRVPWQLCIWQRVGCSPNPP